MYENNRKQNKFPPPSGLADKSASMPYKVTGLKLIPGNTLRQVSPDLTLKNFKFENSTK